MSIQEDLQICKSGDGIEVVDLGEEGNICKTLRVGKNRISNDGDGKMRIPLSRKES
jgi:hypothetical protein